LPAPARADAVDHRAHLLGGDVDREPPPMVRGAGLGGEVADAAQIRLVQLDLLGVGAVARLRPGGAQLAPEPAGLDVHRVPRAGAGRAPSRAIRRNSWSVPGNRLPSTPPARPGNCALSVCCQRSCGSLGLVAW